MNTPDWQDYPNLFRMMPGIILLLDRDLRIVLATEAAEEIRGKDIPLRGQYIFDAFPGNPEQNDDSESKLKESFRKVFSEGVEDSMDIVRYDVREETGYHVAYWRNVNKPVIEKGVVRYILHISEDVTAQMLAEEKSHAFELLQNGFRTFMDSPIIVQILRGPEYIIEFANEASRNGWQYPEDPVGHSIFEVRPEYRGGEVKNMLDLARTKGEMVRSFNLPVKHARGISYFDLVYQQIPAASPADDGVLVLAIDVTEKFTSGVLNQESENRFRIMADGLAWLVSLSDANGVPTFINKAHEVLTGLTAEEITRDFSVALHPDDRDAFMQGYARVLTEKAPLRQEVRVRDKDGVYRTIIAEIAPRFFSNGQFAGLISTAIDISREIELRRELDMRQTELQSIIESVPFPIAFYEGPEYRVKLANSSVIETWGKGADVIGKTFLELLPEIEEQGFHLELEKVYRTGIPFHAVNQPVRLVRDGREENLWFNFSYVPVSNPDGEVYGILNTALDVTEIIQAQLAVNESKKKLEFAIEAAEFATFDLNVPLMEFKGNDRLKEWFGFDISLDSIPLAEAIARISARDRESVVLAIQFALNPASAGKYEAEYGITARRGRRERFVQAKGLTIFDDAGNPVQLNGILRDITADRIALDEIVEKTENLEKAVEIGDLGLFTIDLSTRETHYSERCLEWLGLDDLPMIDDVIALIHPDDVKYVIETIRRTLTGEVNPSHDLIYRINNKKSDREIYLRSIGRTLFLDEKPVGISGILQNVTDQMLERNKIEEEVALRTKELAVAIESLRRSNSDLAQFAYIASHDLQEPLRKVTMFSERLHDLLDTDVPPKASLYLEKINLSTKRMTELIRDVLTFSKVSNSSERFEDVDLDKVLQTTCEDFELIIEQTGAVINASGLRTIQAIPLQMSQLFNNLISNSLKYRQPDAVPEITISAGKATEDVLGEFMLSPVKNYLQIVFEDNGIGFKSEFAEQIFQIFQRLHPKSEYEGTGIGLAICQKIVQNHHGFISAGGSEEGHAKFTILLPEKQD